MQLENCHRTRGRVTGKPLVEMEPAGKDGSEIQTDYRTSVEPLPESTRPRKDGPGGD